MISGRLVFPVVVVMAALLTFIPTRPARALEHTFELDTAGWPEQPRAVALVGTFNGWDKHAPPMARDADGVWRTTLDLDPGVYLYKFLLDGETWLKDPVHSDASLEEPDGHGGSNAAVLIGQDMRDLPPARPNHLVTDALRHNPDDFHHRSVVNKELLLLGLEVREGDAESVQVAVSTNGQSPDVKRPNEPWVLHDMVRESSRLGVDTYVALIETQGQAQVRYTFSIEDGDAAVDFDAGGVRTQGEQNTQPFTVAMTPTFATPDWAKHAVWYQIFPERFRNGTPTNDPGDAPYEKLLPWTSDWWKAHPKHGETLGQKNFYTGAGNVWSRRYGGDLQGVQQALPYLRKLGISALYLNPVFEAESMHKYDTADYRHIDDNFGRKSATPTQQVPGETGDPATWKFSGSDQVFLDLLNEAHAQGFKVVIDGVFNHVGRKHPFFMDVLANGQRSKYADWFEITDWGNKKHWHPMEDPFAVHGKKGGIQWAAWDRPNGHLPVFKNDPATGLADGPRQHIFDITRRWMDPNGDGDPSDGIDGWRLDVPGDIAHPFWIQWRKIVKDLNPDAYISGEIWSWAHPWLQGDQFDAVMNYRFAIPAQNFFVDQKKAMPPSVFAKRLNRVVYNYPMQVALAQMNLFDSHDTDRFASMFVNPDRTYDGQNRIQDNGKDYDPREPDEQERQRQMQAAAFQMAFVGAPMIYYGTEAGMWSPDDPSNRMPMVWEDLQPYEGDGVRFREDIFRGYQRLIALRHTLPVLRVGGFRVIHTDDNQGTFAFERRLGDAHAYIALNRSPQPREIELPVEKSAYMDLIPESQAACELPDDVMERPVLRVRNNAKTLEIQGENKSQKEKQGKRITLKLPAYGVAVLVPAGAVDTQEGTP